MYIHVLIQTYTAQTNTLLYKSYSTALQGVHVCERQTNSQTDRPTDRVTIIKFWLTVRYLVSVSAHNDDGRGGSTSLYVEQP